MHSRLTRWLNRLLSFNFKISQIPGKRSIDLSDRLLSGKTLALSHYDKEFGMFYLTEIVSTV